MGIFKDWGNDVKNVGKAAMGYNGLKSNLDFIKETGKVIISPKNSSTRADKFNSNKTFDDIIRENRISEVEIKKRISSFTKAFYISFIGLLVCIYIILTGFFQVGFFNKISYILPGIAITMLCLSLMFTNTLNVYRLKNRSLITGKEFLKLPILNWIP